MTDRKPPKHLRAEGRRYWRAVAGNFHLEDHHFSVLQVACESLDVAAAAREVLEREGVTTEGTQQRGHPAARILRDSQVNFLRAQRELGLDQEPANPVGRPPGGGR